MQSNSLSNEQLVSLVVPIYKSEENLPGLMDSLNVIRSKMTAHIEVIFVVDGSPDNSWDWLLANDDLKRKFDCHFILLSRNFGALSAVRRGIRQAQGDAVCVFAADGQEPAELVVELAEEVLKGHEVVVGVREDRLDPLLTRILSLLFWNLFRSLGGHQIPRRGVDIFAISRRVCSTLVDLMESSTSLVGLIYWSGFNRKEVPYVRLERQIGTSSWTFRKRAKYALDSVTAFSESPLILLILFGFIGFVASSIFGLFILVSKFFGSMSPPGYIPLLLGISIAVSMQLLSSGILGMYLWRVSENVRNRPVSIDWKVVSTKVAALHDSRLN